jgi:rhodanese-related sulfurtransferase
MKKMILSITMIVLLITVIVGCSPPDTTTDTMDTMSAYEDLSPMEAKELMDNTSDLVIIDVSPKYDEGHLPGAINYFVGDGSLDTAIPMLDKTKTYLVYCHTDSASMLGAQKLVDAGFESVFRLSGNYAAWVDAGYEVEMSDTMMSAYEDLSPMEAKELMDTTSDLLIIDVSPKYAEGHLPGAINYFVGDGSLDTAIPMLDKTKTYLVYCHTDSASMLGAQKLVDAGFESVFRLAGNYAAWVDAGYEVEMSDTMMSTYEDLTPMEARALMDTTPDLVIIDVSPKYDEGHLPGAINYFVGDGSLDTAIPMLDKTKTYLVYCHTDSASMLGAQKLVDAGFESVFRLAGNYAAWVDAGCIVEY